jgi:hypothetical protein
MTEKALKSQIHRRLGIVIERQLYAHGDIQTSAASKLAEKTRSEFTAWFLWYAKASYKKGFKDAMNGGAK